MSLVSKIAVAFVSLIHLYILILEMFLWDKPIGLKAFELSKEFATASKVLAANQGLYNGFLAAGLLWGLSISEIGVQMFFLICVMIAGVFGAITASKKILWIQAMPALLAFALLVLA